MVNLKQIDLALKRSFEKIKRDMNRLEEQGKNTINDLSIIRKNLLDYNGLKKEMDDLKKRIDKLEKNPVEKEDNSPKRGLFSKLIRKRTDEEDKLY